jgi:hypothetical protein
MGSIEDIEKGERKVLRPMRRYVNAAILQPPFQRVDRVARITNRRLEVDKQLVPQK